MKRAILVSGLAVALATAGAAAYGNFIPHDMDPIPASVTFSDNFESYTVGTGIGSCGDWVNGPDISGWTVYNDGGNKVVKAQGPYTGGDIGYIWTGPDYFAGQDDYTLQAFHVMMRKGTASGADWNNGVGIVDYCGSEIARWRINGVGYQPYVYAQDYSYETVYAGPQTAWGDSAYHDFDIHWDVVTGRLDWYVDGVSVATATPNGWADVYFGNPGPIPPNMGNYRSIQHVQLESWTATGDSFFFDDIKVGEGVVPEPSSLAALGMFGLGAFGFFRRRRA